MEFPKLDALLKEPLYELESSVWNPMFLNVMREVTQFHYDHCAPYHRMCEQRGFDPATFGQVQDIPYLPTSLFKEGLFLSIPEDEVFRQIKSSATTSGVSSRVGLDKATSRRQSKCFNKVVVNRIGAQRRKFIVLDEPGTIGRSEMVSARSSTIRSLLFCASDAVACLNEDAGKLSLDEALFDEQIQAAIDANEPVMLFGFTYILYTFVVRNILAGGKRYKLPEGSRVIHIGGWKKLEAEKVTPEKLIADCCEAFGVVPADVVDIYGFTEQSGLIYPSCERGLRHSVVWSDVFARDPVTLEPLPFGEEGLLQFITPIQTSYPGHSVLTEDMGVVLGQDDCPCGRTGKTFKMTGRAPNAEVRGCGDIMADAFA